ncbi:8362_t:CDS:2 [Paraglomus occultum]|uniref:Ribosomal RNA-processing protein 40 n=1 Tax=Paraglomus occultum TaxID=144539 RepID=A0A9N9B4Q1_9GLOM|nr:8362_t:CDS:2 [Paraglomus occultum]
MSSYVLPGDSIPLNLILLPGEPDPKLILGPGLIRQDEDSAMSTKAGIPHSNETERKWFVESNQRRYVPSAGEDVLGIITAKTSEYYRVDIGAAHAAVLDSLAFEGVTRRSKPNLKVGTLIYAQISEANKDIDAELTCINPATNRADGYGVLDKGYIYMIKCSLGLCRRLRNEEHPIWTRLRQKYKFEVIVAVNGRICLKSNSARATIETIEIANAIKEHDV